MIAQCISAVFILGVLILGILVMTQKVTLEQLVGGLGRLLFVGLGSLVALCLLRVLIAISVPWLASLKHVFFWLAVAALAVLALALLERIAVSNLQRWVTPSGDPGEVDYEAMEEI